MVVYCLWPQGLLWLVSPSEWWAISYWTVRVIHWLCLEAMRVTHPLIMPEKRDACINVSSGVFRTGLAIETYVDTSRGAVMRLAQRLILLDLYPLVKSWAGWISMWVCHSFTLQSPFYPVNVEAHSNKVSSWDVCHKSWKVSYLK